MTVFNLRFPKVLAGDSKFEFFESSGASVWNWDFLNFQK